MKNTMVVVADLACLKAFTIDSSPMHSSPRLELLEEFRCNGAHERLVDKVSDQSGRFPRGGSGPNGASAMSAGERHNIELEQRKRLVRQLAGRLNLLLNRSEIERCLLAVSKEINHSLLDALDTRTRAKIQTILPADLTKVDRAELLSHFSV